MDDRRMGRAQGERPKAQGKQVETASGKSGMECEKAEGEGWKKKRLMCHKPFP